MQTPLKHMKIRRFQGAENRYAPVSNSFGMVRNNHQRPHQGWDLEAKPGTLVYAVAPGSLTTSFGADYGHCLELEFVHRGTTYFAFYAHLGGFLIATPRCIVEGTRIAITGRSGNASNLPVDQSHLHFEIRTKRHVAKGLSGRIDPGQLFGYGIYTCSAGDTTRPTDSRD